MKLLVGRSRLKKSLAREMEVQARPQAMLQAGVAGEKAVRRRMKKVESCMRVVARSRHVDRQGLVGGSSRRRRRRVRRLRRDGSWPMAFMKRTERMRSRRGKTPKARRAVPVASSTQRRRAFLNYFLS